MTLWKVRSRCRVWGKDAGGHRASCSRGGGEREGRCRRLRGHRPVCKGFCSSGTFTSRWKVLLHSAVSAKYPTCEFLKEKKKWTKIILCWEKERKERRERWEGGWKERGRKERLLTALGSASNSFMNLLVPKRALFSSPFCQSRFR